MVGLVKVWVWEYLWFNSLETSVLVNIGMVQGGGRWGRQKTGMSPLISAVVWNGYNAPSYLANVSLNLNDLMRKINTVSHCSKKKQRSSHGHIWKVNFKRKE